MRPIIFRGKRIDTGEWAEGFYRKNSFYNKLVDNPLLIYEKHFIGKFDNIDYFDGIFEQVEVIPETVGQYIGRNDKNNIKAFEGDEIQGLAVLTDANGYDTKFNVQGVIRYSEDFLALVFVETVKTPIENYVSFMHQLEFFEIIGSIHDNKNLING